MIGKKILSLLFILKFFLCEGQFYHMPSENTFAVLTEKYLAEKDSSIHPGIKPYIPFFNNKYNHRPETHSPFKYIKDDPGVDVIFMRHIIQVQPPKENFKLTLDPLLNLEAGRDAADPVTRNLYNNTRGFIGSGQIGNKFYFETMLAENQSVLPKYLEEYTRTTQVVPGQGRWKTFKIRGFDYAFSSGFVSVQPLKNLNIQAGHGKQKIGHGYRSLILSDNAFNYPYLRFTHQWFKGRLQYSNIYAALMNLVPAAKVQTPNSERLFQKKAASFHYLSLNLGKRINVGLFQGLIWQAGNQRNKHVLSFEYYNPVIFSNIPILGFDNKHNLLAGADFLYKVTDHLNVYAQLMADDTDRDSLGVNTGYQAGIKWFSSRISPLLSLQVEYNSTGRGAYNSPQSVATNQSYSHYNQNLAYLPLNGDELVITGHLQRKRFFATARYNYQTSFTGKAAYTYQNIINARLGYLINPAYNLNISVGVNNRTQIFSNFKPSNNQTGYIYVALKTSLYNLYYDF